ncbi:hypothetical protein [Streptomyces sp. NPDC017993]|uniref:hypothetical protein n=1 Tax=Streptomyces sp. NPDC017993 TaxID=3365027 RepID=UPI0037A21937
MRRWRTRTALSAVVALIPLALVAGCAGVEGLQSDGRARDVKAPLALWPEYSPAPLGREDNPAALERVPGLVPVPSGDMTGVNELTVLDADLTADGGSPPKPSSVRRPVLHDLTDDRKPDLITVVDIDPRVSELRVYSVQDKAITRVLALRGVLAGVELAAGHLAIREPTKDPRYVSVTDYVWDGDSMGLWDLTLDEARKPQTPSPSGRQSPSPVADGKPVAEGKPVAGNRAVVGEAPMAGEGLVPGEPLVVGRAPVVRDAPVFLPTAVGGRA